MTVELKGNFLGTHSTVSKSNGNTYYKADVYCDDGDTVRVSIPSNLVESINGIKKFSEICWCVCQSFVLFYNNTNFIFIGNYLTAVREPCNIG